jgi:hypothetical protein
MKWGKISPTDIDAILEFDGRAAVIYEVKLAEKWAALHRQGRILEVGQEKLLTRMRGKLQAAGMHTLVILAEHYASDPNQPIPLRDCRVLFHQYGGTNWNDIYNGLDAFEVTDRFLKRHGVVDTDGHPVYSQKNLTRTY